MVTNRRSSSGAPLYAARDCTTVRRGAGRFFHHTCERLFSTVSNAGVDIVLSSACGIRANRPKDVEHYIITPNEQLIFPARTYAKGQLIMCNTPTCMAAVRRSKHTLRSSNSGGERWRGLSSRFFADDFTHEITGLNKERPEAR